MNLDNTVEAFDNVEEHAKFVRDKSHYDLWNEISLLALDAKDVTAGELTASSKDAVKRNASREIKRLLKELGL